MVFVFQELVDVMREKELMSPEILLPLTLQPTPSPTPEATDASNERWGSGSGNPQSRFNTKIGLSEVTASARLQSCPLK